MPERAAVVLKAVTKHLLAGGVQGRVIDLVSPGLQVNGPGRLHAQGWPSAEEEGNSSSWCVVLGPVLLLVLEKLPLLGLRLS